MEMRNVPKRQQIDRRAENSQRPLQHSEIIPHPEAFFSWTLNKNANLLSDSGRQTQL